MTKLFVFDTNCLISAHLLPQSVSRNAYDRARTTGIAVYSDSILTEFAETFMRPKFDRYVTAESRLAAISDFEKLGQHIQVGIRVDACRDPKDNKFLELALETGASCIVSGDKDLLVLNPFENIPIVTPADFIRLF